MSLSSLHAALPAPAQRTARHLWHRVVRARFFCALLRDNWLDSLAFLRHSHDGRTDRARAQQENAIVKMYHGVEKGLCLAEPRPGFGKVKIRHLTRKIDDWLAKNPATPLILSAIGSLESYQRFNAAHDAASPWLEDWLRRTRARVSGGHLPAGSVEQHCALGGTRTRSRDEILEAVAGTGAAFFETRHSMRQFGPGPVPAAVIEEAVRRAQRAPSACNRQGPRVHAFANAIDALQYQPGNAGFGASAGYGLVVTSDLQCFSGAGERHQAYVDGGIFAMALVYALHAQGYGSCMLAWNAAPEHDRKTKAALGIPESEVIVMMIAVGELPETFQAAQSARRPVEAVLRRA
ncbi:nitroreductase family protein [Frigidibacter sp. MR17.24]|uniref:nitroreductase family protein n=1 Tax=Frigidibacter sp. MR17.24 TaxID=3127345 RepID=UPI003012AB7A